MPGVALQFISAALIEDWMRTERAGLSRHAAVAKAMDYMLKRWDGFARFLDDNRICLKNNAAERALRPFCLGRKSWLFAGSDRGGEGAAVMYNPHRHRQAQRRRPPGLAGRRPRPHRRTAADPSQHELLPCHWRAELRQELAA